MERGGRAWRGFFPVGAQLTSGRPDLKEGLYFGAELPADDPRVRAGVPLHGGNLFPRQIPRLRPLVLAYLDALTNLGQAALAGVALSLGLDAGYFATGYTADPTILFRIFHYPPSPPQAQDWGVGEHTDYGLVTLLAQDDAGGLQIAAPEGWIDAPPLPGTLICNIGDMLDRLTGSWYRSTPHRVRNLSGHGRLSSHSSWTWLRRRGAAAARPGRRRRRWPTPLGRPRLARLHRHLRRLPPQQSLKSLPPAPSRHSGITSAQVRSARSGRTSLESTGSRAPSPYRSRSHNTQSRRYLKSASARCRPDRADAVHRAGAFRPLGRPPRGPAARGPGRGGRRDGPGQPRLHPA